MINRFIMLLMLFCVFFDAVSQKNDSSKIIKKKEKVEKRYINPKSKYLSFSAGLVFNFTYTNDPNNFFDKMTMYNNGKYPSIVYEHGIKNNFFAEVGYDLTPQSISLSRDMGNEQAWGLSTSYANYIHPAIKQKSHNLHFGGGYRLIGVNNFHFLNFHGGLFFGVSNKSNSFMSEYIGNKATFTPPYGEQNYLIERTLESYSPISLGAYLGVSKEIRISEEIRLFVKYTHRFGFLTTSTGSYVMISDDLIFDHKASFFVRGGGGSYISLGLKLLLFKKRLNSYEK